MFRINEFLDAAAEGGEVELAWVGAAEAAHCGAEALERRLEALFAARLGIFTHLQRLPDDDHRADGLGICYFMKMVKPLGLTSMTMLPSLLTETPFTQLG